MGTGNLNQLRERIDALDGQIAELIRQRIELANSIMKAKAPQQIVDSAREQEILGRYLGKLEGLSTPAKSKRLVSAILAVSGLYPET